MPLKQFVDNPLQRFKRSSREVGKALVGKKGVEGMGIATDLLGGKPVMAQAQGKRLQALKAYQALDQAINPHSRVGLKKPKIV